MREAIINNLVTIQCGSYSEILTFAGSSCILIPFPDKRQTITTCWECRHRFQDSPDLCFPVIRQVFFWLLLGRFQRQLEGGGKAPTPLPVLRIDGNLCEHQTNRIPMRNCPWLSLKSFTCSDKETSWSLLLPLLIFFLAQPPNISPFLLSRSRYGPLKCETVCLHSGHTKVNFIGGNNTCRSRNTKF